MPLLIVRNDITEMNTDAIVNAANPLPMVGSGLDKAVYQKAGWQELLAARRKIGQLAVGCAAVTPGFGLKAKYIIHAVGPVWRGGEQQEEQLLKACYANALAVAQEQQCKSVAFPLIATGNYGFPKDRALRLAVATINEFLLANEMLVYLVVFDKEILQLSSKLVVDVQSYVDENYVAASLEQEYEFCEEVSERRGFKGTTLSNVWYGERVRPFFNIESSDKKSKERSLEDLLGNLDDTFSEALLKWIDAKGMTDPEVYKSANIDRKLFSKIRKNKNYRPSKNTAVALALALKLNLDETKDFIGKAGYTLSHSSRFDVIVEYFIINNNYDVMELNEVLFKFDEQLIGA